MGLNGSGSGKVVDVGGDMVIVTLVLPEGLKANGQSGSIEAVSVNGVEICITSEDEGSFSGALARAVSATDAFRDSGLTASYDADADALVITGSPAESVMLDMGEVLTEAVESMGGYGSDIATKYPSVSVASVVKNGDTLVGITVQFKTSETLSNSFFVAAVFPDSRNVERGSELSGSSNTDLSSFSGVPVSGMIATTNATHNATVTSSDGFSDGHSVSIWIYYNSKWVCDHVVSSTAVDDCTNVLSETIYVGSSGDDNDDGKTESTAVATLATAYSKVPSGGKIVLLSNLTQGSTLNFDSDKTVTLTSKSGETHTISRGTANTLINVTAGCLTLENVTINGNSTGSDFLVKVGHTSGNPTLTLGSGATVTKGGAGGILLGVSGNASGSHGTLTIDGGTVSECGGKVFYLNGTVFTSVAGVAVIGDYTHFTMNSGSVTGNLNNSDKKYAGGIIFAYNNRINSSAVINGGTISGNEGVSGSGGILLDSEGKLVLNGGTITGNKGSKVYGGGVGIWATSSSLCIGGNVTAPLVIKDNTDSDGNASNLMLHDSIVVAEATGGLAEGSEVHILHYDIQNGGTSKKEVVASSASGEEEFFVSDKPYVVGILRSGSAIYLSPDAREGSIIYVNANSGSSTQDGTSTNPYKTIEAAYSAAKTNDTIVLLSDITISSQVQFSSSKKVTIASGWEGGSTYSIKSEYSPSSTDNSQDYLFYVTSGSVTFKDITIDGNNQKNYPGAIKVDTGATATLGTGVTVKNFKSYADKASGGQAVLNAQASDSTLIIDGATITGCTLSGGNTGNPASIICSGEAATVEMRSGTITGNTLNCEGSSIVNLGQSKTPKFYMTGGSITDNTVTLGYGALYTCGNASTCDIQFGGSAIVYDNTDSSGNQKNILIKNSGATDTSSCLKLQSSLTGDAKLGISASSVGESTLVITGAGTYTVTADDASHIESDKTNVAVVFDKADSKIKLSIEAMEAVYVSVNGNDSTGDGTRTNPVKTISKAYSLVKSGGKIFLLTDISQGKLELSKSKDVTIVSADNTDGVGGAKKAYTISRNTDDNLFYIAKGSLTLQDVVLTDPTEGRYKALVRACSGAELVLDSGAAVKNVKLTTSSSGTSQEWGILVAEAGGTITMKDGSLIDSCRATSGPVRISGSNAKFNMEGGTISSCNSSYREGNAVYVAGGAVFTMSGGQITGCGSTGGSLNGTVYLHDSGTNSFVMTGGEITGNTAAYGGGVYSANSSNTITVSGTAKIHGNTGKSLGGESNIYLYSGQTVTVGEGGLENGADIGVYTASSPTSSSDVKFATGASAGDAKYFHSDKTITAGVVYCDGTTDSIEGTHHTDHSAGTLWLSVIAAGYAVNVALVDGVQCITDNLSQSGINNGTKTFQDIVLSADSNYVTLTQEQATAINNKLSGTGLTAAYSNGKITISAGTEGLEGNVSLDLATILTGGLVPKLGEAKIGETVYTTLVEALNVAKGNSDKDTIEIVSSSVGAVTSAELKNKDVLKDRDGNSYTATSDSVISVSENGSVTLTSGGLDVKKGKNGDAPLTVITNGYTVTGSDFSVSIEDEEKSTLTVTTDTEAQIDGAAFGPGTYTLSKTGGKTDATLSADASVSGSDGTKIVGVSGENATKVEIDAEGKLTLVGGKGSVTGEETVSVRTTDGKTVEVTVPEGTTAIIDADAGTVVVDKGCSVTAGDITYRSGNEGGSSFSITECKLTNNGDSATISGGATESMSVKLGDGENPQEITIPGDNQGDAVVTKNSSSSTVELGETGDRFTVDEKDYKAGSDGSSFTVGSDGGVTIVSGSVLIGDGASVTGASGKPIENPSGTLSNKIEVRADKSKDIVTVPASGQVSINGTTYENASQSGSAVIEATSSGNKLVEGEIKLVKDRGIEVNGVAVDRTNETGNITVKVVSGGSGSMVVPEGGAVKFDITTITSTSGEVTIDIGTDGKLVVTVPSTGQVTIGGQAYTGSILTVDPSTGDVSGAKNIIISDDNLRDSTFTKKLEAEQVVTAGKYTYTAAAGGATIKSRVDSSGNALNPTVVLEDGKTVQIGLSSDKTVSTAYTATAADTKIAMSSDDTDTTKINLLAGGLENIKGVTVTGGNNTIKAVDAGAKIELVNGNAKLTSGEGSSSGTMGAAISDIGDKAFNGNGTQYTVDTSEKKLVLNQAGSVKMDDKVTFTGKAGSSFDLDGDSNEVSTAVLKGESITGSDGLSIEGTAESGQGAKVKIDADGKLTLVGGTATVGGKGDLTVISGSESVSVSVPEGKSYTVDPSTGVISVSGEGDTVVIDGVTYTSVDGKSSFNLDNTKGALTIEGDSAVVPSSGSATIELGTGDKAKKIAVDNSSSSNSGDVTITKGDGVAGGTVEIAKKGDKVTIGGNTYTAPCDNTEYVIDSQGNVSVAISLDKNEAYTLNAGETVIIGDYTYTAPAGGVTLVGREAGENPAVRIDSQDGTVKVGLKEGPEAGITYTAGSANTELAMSEDDTDGKHIDLLEEGSKISSTEIVTVNGGGNVIMTVDGSTIIELEGGKATLISGSATVSGGDSASVDIGGSVVVDVTVPEGTVTLDIDEKTAKVDNGKSVVIDGVTYTSGSTGGSAFPLDAGKLTSDGDKAAIPGGKATSMTIGSGTSPVVQVPKDGASNVGNVVITKTSEGGSIRIEKAGDSFKVGDKTYVAGSDGAVFSVDTSGNVKLTGGSATIGSGESITTSNGSVITGSEGAAKVTVGDGKDVVTVPSTGGKVNIGDAEYTSAGDGTQIETSSGGNELIGGSVLLDEGESITVDGVTVKGDGSEPVEAGTTGDGKATVTVPEGGQAVIDGATIGGSDGAVIDITDGKTVVEIDAGKKVTINDKSYEGGDNGTTRTIGTDGKVQQSKVTIDTGSGSGSSVEEEIDTGDTIKLPDQTKVDPPKPQQVLVGWKATDESGSETEYGIGSDYTVEGNAKVEAVYTDSSKVLVYTVDGKGGSVTGTTFEELDGSPVKLKEEGAQKEGYTFAGWKPKDGKDAVYAPGVSLDATQTTYMEAYFIPNSAKTVTLTYVPENGSANVKKQTVEVGETVWLPTSLDMSRPGYTFKGWATESVTENEPVTLGAEASSTAGRTMIKTSYYTVKEDETLYAVWESGSSDNPGWWEDDDDPAWYDPTVVPSDDGSSNGNDGKRIALIIAAIAVAMTELAVLIAYRKK